MSQLRNIKRRQAKFLKNKKKIKLSDVAKMAGAVPFSICSEHGPYAADRLCACYDKGGSHEGVNYKNIELDPSNFMTGCVCPIHGEYSTEKPCACYGKDGNLKEGWDKDLAE